jgi:ectoine hydroxylase-related dioxygenase (phytanoyl-CoA dioxygenase family)
MAELKHFDSKVDVKTITETLEKDGALILNNVVDAEFLAALRAETDPYMETTSNGADDFGGRLTTRTGGLMMRSEKCRDLIMDPRIMEPCNAFLSPYCEKVQLHLTQIIRIRAGEKAQPIHRDRWAWGTHLAHVEPQFNTIWAITDFTAENGATQLVPGSTKWPDDAKIDPTQITQAEMKAGSVLIYSGSVFHGGGANRSDGDRIGINITYTLGWLRQEENQYLTCPPELAKTLPRELQALAGYAMGQYALGYFTPPGAPGEAPEVVPPEYALGIDSEGSSLGDYEALDVVKKSNQVN